MRDSRICTCLVISLVLGTMTATPAMLTAQDFRVETGVYAAGNDRPFAENLTLFTTGVVYDFSRSSEETTIFDPGRERFVLLDTRRRVKTVLSLEELGKYVADLRQQGLKSNHPLQYEPKFTAGYSASKRQLTMSSDSIVYRVSGTTPPAGHTSAVGLYRQFTDWNARLNATHQGSFPPFARLELNRELEERELLPEQVELEFTSDSKEKATFSSKHAFAWNLTTEDHRRIEDVGRQMKGFTSIGFRQYRQNRP